jgi:hypothetical protein
MRQQAYPQEPAPGDSGTDSTRRAPIGDDPAAVRRWTRGLSAVALLVLAVVTGCDVEPIDASTPRATLVGICAEACSPLHCENVIMSAVEYEADGDDCESDCQWTQVACLLDAGDHCGTCEHEAAECRTACGWGLVTP